MDENWRNGLYLYLHIYIFIYYLKISFIVFFNFCIIFFFFSYSIFIAPILKCRWLEKIFLTLCNDWFEKNASWLFQCSLTLDLLIQNNHNEILSNFQSQWRCASILWKIQYQSNQFLIIPFFISQKIIIFKGHNFIIWLTEITSLLT